MNAGNEESKGRVLVLAPTPRDAAVTEKLLVEASLEPVICYTMNEACERLFKEADAAILTEETILADKNEGLLQCLQNQPAWSDFPLIVLTPAGKDSAKTIEALQAIGNMTLMKRPVQVSELLSTVQSALRDRRRQYVLRDYLIEHERQAEALRRSEEQYDLAMRGMNDGLWDWNLVDNTIYYAPRYKSMLGYGERDLEDKIETWQKLLHPEDHDVALETAERYLAGDIPEYKNIFRMRHKDGSWRWILSRAHALRDESGKAYRMVGAHTDITEQKELEEQLRQAIDKAEAANRAKSEFLANMSHEIRTPMNAVVGLANILATTDPNHEKRHEFLHTLQISAQSMMALINDLLDIAKIENESVELESLPFTLPRLMEEVISIMALKAEEKGIALKMTSDTERREAFLGDPVRLKQILMNLIGNAIKFTHEGSVTIRTQVSDGANEGQVLVSIDVIDTGVGIASDKLGSIFGKFSQADSSITRKYGGTGLGLAITRALAGLMGGTVSVISEEGKGSTFSVRIPLKRQAIVLQSAAIQTPTIVAASRELARSPRILLAEDYEANVLVATSMLEYLGYGCDVARNGEEVLTKLKASVLISC